MTRRALRNVSVIGRVEGGNVTISADFLRWLEEGFRDVDQIAQTTNSQTGEITTLDGRLDDVEAAVAAAATPVYMRANIGTGSITNATWNALTLTTLASAGVDFSAPTFEVPSGAYSVAVKVNTSGPSDWEWGYTTDGGSGWTSLGSGLGDGFHILPVELTEGDNVQFGIRPNGGGTLDSGTVFIVRETFEVTT